MRLPATSHGGAAGPPSHTVDSDTVVVWFPDWAIAA